MTVDNVFVSVENKTKSPSKILVPYKNSASLAMRCYASVDGKSKIVYPGTSLNHIDFIIQELGVSDQLNIYNRWNKPIVVKNLDTNTSITVPRDNDNHFITAKVGNTISIEESEPNTFKDWWRNEDNGLIHFGDIGSTTTGKVKCVYMPQISVFTEDNDGTVLGDYAFRGFNSNGAITEFPVDSFDTATVTTVGFAVFQNFNYNGRLLAMPKKSLCFPLVSKVGAYFMQSFNHKGDMYYMPDDAFDIRSIVEAGNYYLQWFNGQTNTDIGPPGGPYTTQYYCGALVEASSGSPLFINNVSNTSVVYRGNSSSFTVINKGANMKFNTDPTSDSNPPYKIEEEQPWSPGL